MKIINFLNMLVLLALSKTVYATTVIDFTSTTFTDAITNLKDTVQETSAFWLTLILGVLVYQLAIRLIKRWLGHSKYQ